MFIKKRLLTPGPTATSETVRLALATSLPHHRSPESAATHLQLMERLRWLWDTDDDVLFVSGSGTAAMEAGLRTCIRKDDAVVVATGGKFAERWLTIAEQLSDTVTELPVAWGESIVPAAFRAFVASLDACDAFVCVASETSTGALHPIAELSAIVRERFPDALIMIDGITAVGTVDLSMKRDHIDVLVSGTQKSFGLPPGGAMAGVSARAWARADRPGCQAYYLDLRRERKQTATGQTAFTPAIGLVHALNEVLGEWQAAGRDELFAHAALLAAIVRAGAQALGLALYAQGSQSPALTAIEMPADVSAKAVTTWMRDHLGSTASAGQDAVKDRIVRIGHIGAVDAFDMLQAVSALELGLLQAGAQITVGDGVRAAQELLARELPSARLHAYIP